MTIKHNVAGVWKANVPKINVAGTWKSPTVKINVAGTWKAVGGPSVDMGVIVSVSNIRPVGGACYAGLDIRANGICYKLTNIGGYTSTGTWLTSGSNSEVWVSRSITSGTLNIDEVGSGRAAMTADRQLSIQTIAIKSTTVTITFWDAASGGNQLGSKSVTFDAEAGNQ